MTQRPSPKAMLTAVVTAALVVATLVSGSEAAKEKKKPHPEWRTTYHEALLEARIRGVPVFVTRHKDECGRCVRHHRNVLSQKSFIAWANENLVLFVAHNERLHDTVEVEEDGKKVSRCPLYPGLACRDHVRAAVDVDTARDEGLVKIPFVTLCPNSWLVSPTDEVEQIPEKEQFQPKAIRKQAEALQAKLGKPLDRARFPAVRTLLLEAEESADDELWKKSLTSLAGIQAVAPTPPGSLKKLIDGRLAAIEETVRYETEEALEAAKPTDEHLALAKRLFAAVDVAVYGAYLPIRDQLKSFVEGS